jgi:membrane fusion protein, multidrug efflux system
MRMRATLLFGAAMAVFAGGCGDSSAVSPAHVESADAGNRALASSSSPSGSASTAGSAATQDVLSVLSVEHQIDITTQRDGVVVSVALDEGSLVTKGEVLGQLDDRTLQIQLVKARDDLQIAQNNVKYKQAELKARGAALTRQEQLRKLGLSSEADLEQADFEAKAAEFDMHGWEATVESNQQEIKRLEIETDQTRLRAPFAGAVVVRYVREGQQVAKGDKCFRVSQLAPLQVQFQVPESAAKRPTRGAPVDLILVTDPDHNLTARVTKVSPVVDPSSDSYNVTAELAGKGLSELRPGMAVRVVWPGTSAAKP